MKKVLWLLALTVLIVAAVMWAKRPQPVEVTVRAVDRGVVESTVANTRAGTIKACRRAGLSLNSGGQVEELRIKEGDHVKAGDLLLRLQNDTQKALLVQAQAQLRKAHQRKEEVCFKAENDRRENARMEKMFAQKLAADEAMDASRTRAVMSKLVCAAADTEIAEANAHVALQQALLNQTALMAPFDGVVAEINGELGEYVTPSPPGVATPPAVDLIDDSCLYVQAPIDEVDAAAVSLGLTARVTLDAFRGRELSGTVTRIAPYVQDLEKQARTVDVDVVLSEIPSDIRLLVGYSADLEIILAQHDDTLRVPTETVFDENHVLRVNPLTKQLESVEISVGLRNWVYTEATTGLEAGDQIVQSLDVDGVEPGALVKVAP